MKIAMMTRWNMPSGQASHAEPIGRAWVEMGHKLKVFAPKDIDITALYYPDEPYVCRCYMQDVWEQRERSDYFFDRRPFLEEDYQIFVVEHVEIMPMPELLEIFPQIKKKARTVFVVHEVGLLQNPNWYKFDWDAIVCFDIRYKEFMAKAFSQEKIAIIPYPCHAPLHGDKKEARINLGLPLDKKILFAYGYDTIFYHINLFPVMERLSQDYPLLFLLLTHNTGHGVAPFQPMPDFVLIREEMPTVERLYSYLHASDAYVYYGRTRINGVGVASCIATCLGAGRPVLVPGYCNFFDLSGKEVIRYSDFDELEHRLRDVFKRAGNVRESLAAAGEYATRNSGSAIAYQFIRLFGALLGGD